VLVVLGGVLIFLYTSYYPTSLAERGRYLFEQAKRPHLPYEVKLYRDTFEVIDEYGSRIGYFSEQKACVETKEMILLNLSADQAPVILPKRCFGSREQEICELLQFAFGKRYLR
jgi:hypothetical protein